MVIPPGGMEPGGSQKFGYESFGPTHTVEKNGQDVLGQEVQVDTGRCRLVTRTAEQSSIQGSTSAGENLCLD